MRLVTKADFDFSGAALYRKVEPLLKCDVRIAQINETIISRHSGGVETTNQAKPGDYIISHTARDGAYILEAHRFPEIYEEDPADSSSYRAKEVRKALLTLEDVTFMAPWGTEQQVLAGGMIIEAGDYIYGVDKFSFIQKYGRVDDSPEAHCFVRMNEDLHLQYQRAESRNLVNHMRDIDSRLIHANLCIE